MPQQERLTPAGIRAPRWRALLEARWQARLQEVTELSLAYHAAAAVPAGPSVPADPSVPAGPSAIPAGPSAIPAGPGGETREQEARRLQRRELQCRDLLCRTIAARRKLADVEEALGRLAAGTFGACEQCGAQIPARLLAADPARRYCSRCAAGDDPAPALSDRSRA
jgi:hypothetical protein